MNDETPENKRPVGPPPPVDAAEHAGAPSRWPWLIAAGCALFASLLFAAYLSLRAEVTALREQTALSEIQGKVLEQQIEAERILSARRMADLTGELREPRNLDRFQLVLLGPPAGSAIASRAIIVRDQGRLDCDLIVSTLPALGPDQRYQLWLLDPQHPAGTSLVVFAPDAASGHVCVPFKLDRPNLAGASFKISIEPAGGAAVPDGAVVLASDS
jgi:Anti-sigma-K factor rskA